MGWFARQKVSVGLWPDAIRDAKAWADMDAALKRRRDVMARCGADTREDPYLIPPWFDGRESPNIMPASIGDLFACIDALERRVADLEKKAGPQ